MAFSESSTDLHAAAAVGEWKKVQELLRKGADANYADVKGMTPLHWAALNGHEASVRLLLTSRGDANAKEENGYTPLHCAAQEGHLKVMTLLIDAAAHVKAENVKGETPLHLAAYGGHEAAARFLLEKACDVGAKTKDGWTPLHLAAFKGHEAAVQLLLRSGGDVGAKDKNGSTPLYMAAFNGHEAAVRLMLTSEGDANAKDKNGYTPLHCAAQEGHLKVMTLLIEDAAHVKAENVKGFTPLDCAAVGGHIEAMKLLIDAGAEIDAKNVKGSTPLHLAAIKGREAALQFLLNLGGDVGAKEKDGTTPLHYAAQEGHIEAVRLLINAGAQVDDENIKGTTPLHYAAQEGHLEAVRLLINAGAQVDDENIKGSTPLHLAASKGHEAAVRLLLKSGGDANAKNNEGLTPLHWAVFKGHEAAVQLLLTSGGDANATVENGFTPLHYASVCGHEGAVRLLLTAGADVEATIKNGRTPLHIATQNGHLEAMKKLRDSGAAINVKDLVGRTPLHFAVVKNQIESVQFLVDAGAELNAKDNEGLTPLHLAVSNTHLEAVRWLINAGADLNTMNIDGQTPLHLAAAHDFLEAVQVLSDAGVETDTKDAAGWSPLAVASAFGNLPIVKILLHQGRADPSLASDKGWMPLDCAAHYNHLDVVNLLKDFNARASSVILPSQGGSRCHIETETIDGISAMLNSVEEIVKRETAAHTAEKDLSFCAALTGTLNLTGNIHEIPGVTNDTDRRDITRLHYAALGGHDSLVKSLIAAGSNVEALTHNGASVLHFASLSGRLSTVQMVAQHVNPGLVDAQGLTAEQYAQARGHHHIAWWLSKRNKKHDQSSSLNLNALYNLIGENLEKMVYHSNNVEACEALLNSGVWDLHFQDERGRTPLHVAALNNRRHDVEFLLERGALPSARTHHLKKPSDLATVGGHHELEALFLQRNSNHPRSESGKCRLYDQLLRLILKTSQEGCEDQPRRCLDAVKQCTSLLESGAPLEPLCCHDIHALHLAIACNCTPLLPLLLSTGVPLTATLDSLDPVGLAWWSEYVTPWVGVLVTRAVEHKLKVEMDFEAVTSQENILKRMMDDLVVALRGNRPWRAKCPDFIIPETNVLDGLLYTASKRGATTAVWWIWKKGGYINPLEKKGSTPLHAAIEAGNVETALAMINHMKANPFLTDSKNLTALDLLPDKERKNCLENSQRKEYRLLSKILFRVKDRCDQHDIMKLILFHLVLTLQHGYIQANALIKPCWKGVLKLMTDSLLEKFMPHSWISDFVTSLTDRCLTQKKIYSTHSENKCDYSALIAVANDLFTISDWQIEIQNYGHQLDEDHKDLQRKAMRFCCEEDLPLFLHLLVTVAKVSVNSVIDTEYDVTALHHAARSNKPAALMYLINQGASETDQDKMGNLAGHHAFMHGNRDIFRAINISWINSTGMTPQDIGKSFTQYMKLYHISPDNDDLDPHERNDVKKVTRIHLKRLGKEWENKGIATSVQEIHVDFTKGEALEIKKAINELIIQLLDEIKLSEPLLEGKHKMLGSSEDNVRLHAPDEFDANIVLKNVSAYLNGEIQMSITSKEVDHKGRTAFINLTSDNEDIHHLLQDSNLLDRFYGVIKKCFFKCKIEDRRLSVMSPGITRTQVGVGLKLLWIGFEFEMLHVDVDLVPTIESPWPEQLPRPELTPPDLKTVYVNSTGNGEWRMSFAQAENIIMKNLTDEQRTVFLACKMILSKLKVEGWAPQVIKNQFKYFNSRFFKIPSPKGFSLKNSFFRELEEISDAKLWIEEHGLERMISVFRRMCVEVCDPDTEETTLDSGKIKAYFGGDFEGACAGFGAPDVVRFLESLENTNIWQKID